MGIPIRIEHLKRYRDIAKLLVKYGSYDLVRRIGLDEMLDRKTSPSVGVARQGRELADDLENMGPTFVKLGQVLSTRPDILPMEYASALARLQSDVESFPYDQVKEIVECELGMPIDQAFAEFEEKPSAAASIGQVHRARLHGGRAVAVKVQRPGIRDRMMDDLEVLQDVADFIDGHTEFGEIYKVAEVFQEFRLSLMQELDYLLEKRNYQSIRAALKEFDRIVVPEVIAGHTTSRVLTMEFVEGVKITSLTSDEKALLDTDALLAQLLQAYLKQILLDGRFHADPHPGNLVITVPDGRIGLLDLGMVARVTPELQDRLIRFVLAMSEGKPEEAADIAASMGEKTNSYDPRRYRRRATALIARYQQATLSQINPGTLMAEFTEISKECGIRTPRELAMLGKVMVHLDQVTSTLNPEFEPLDHIRKAAGELLIKHVTRDLSVGCFLRFFLAMRDIAGRLPRTMGQVLDQIANNELRIKVDVFDEALFFGSIRKLGNRIALGLLLGSMMVGAGLLSSVPTAVTIMGYPALAVGLFLIAAAGALGLILDILIDDERRSGSKKAK